MNVMAVKEGVLLIFVREPPRTVAKQADISEWYAQMERGKFLTANVL